VEVVADESAGPHRTPEPIRPSANLELSWDIVEVMKTTQITP